MAAKRPLDEASEEEFSKASKPKFSRKSLTLETKLDIIERHDRGEKTNHIARVYDLASSTVSTILKAADSIRRAAETVSSLQAKRNTKKRAPAMAEMERQLEAWIHERRVHGGQPSTAQVTAKALELWANAPGGAAQFKASKGWFERFKVRAGLTGKAEGCEGPVRRRMEEAGYSTAQVLHLGRTGLFWRRAPAREFRSDHERGPDERVILLMGCNALGDFKAPPLVLSHRQPPGCAHLPIAWGSSPEAFVTGLLSPALETYAAQKGVANRFLLLAGSELPATLSAVPNIEVMKAPNNVVEQAVFAAFKDAYKSQTMRQLIADLRAPDQASIDDFWRRYDVPRAVQNIAEAWREVPAAKLQGAWHRICPSKGRLELPRPRAAEAVFFKEAAAAEEEEEVFLKEEVEEEAFLKAEAEEETFFKEEPPDDFQEEEESGHISEASLRAILVHFEQGLELLKELDPNPVRSEVSIQLIEEGLRGYRDLFQAQMDLEPAPSQADFHR